MKMLCKLSFLTAAWLLCSGFTASAVCESSIASCLYFTGAINGINAQNVTGQNTGEHHSSEQNAPEQNTDEPNMTDTNPSGQETAYILDDRYLIQYSGGYDNQMGIYDLNTLQNGAFGDYVIRSYNSFRFTEPMRTVFLQTAMNDASFQKEPWFAYYDQNGLLRLELYVVENGSGCGICYNEIETETSVERSGFAFAECCRTAWEDASYPMTFEAATYFRDVPSLQTEEGFRNYKESYEYNAEGQVTAFSAEAETNFFSDEWEPVTIASYRCVYREDGSRKEEELSRNPLLFSTSDSSARLEYDTAGRIVYIRSYITHGSLEYYFIYEGDSEIPAYGVMIDHNIDLKDGIFYQYH